LRKECTSCATFGGTYDLKWFSCTVSPSCSTSTQPLVPEYEDLELFFNMCQLRCIGGAHCNTCNARVLWKCFKVLFQRSSSAWSYTFSCSSDEVLAIEGKKNAIVRSHASTLECQVLATSMESKFGFQMLYLLMSALCKFSIDLFNVCSLLNFAINSFARSTAT